MRVRGWARFIDVIAGERDFVGAEGFYRELFEAVTQRGDRAVVRITAAYEPVGGAGTKIFPPTYPPRAYSGQPEPSPYVLESRFVDGKRREDVLLDAVASQANRAEEALLKARRSGVALPLLELRHHGETEVVLTSLEFPHRYADAYLKDSLLDGMAFDRTALGKSMLAASLADTRALYANDPGSLVFGAWNSHRKGRQQKFPRAYASEVVGWDPVVGARNAGRMDPLNLQGAARRSESGWEFLPAGEKVKGERLSEIGHGNIAPNAAHGGVTISSATRTATLSLAVLGRIGFGDVPADSAVAARTVLAAYALLADRLAFGGPGLWLRSGCELVTLSERLEWIGRGGLAEPFELPADVAVRVFELAVARAAECGLPLSTETQALTPSRLAKAIEFSLTKAAPAED
jgi:CRISPR-associated protein Csb1